MPLFPVYVLDVPSTHQPFSVYLNGWLLDSSEGGEQAYFSSSKIGRYVADGTNTLTIHVLPPAPSHPVPEHFQVRIRSTEGEVFYYDWDPTAPHHPPLPFTTEKHFIAHLPHPWAWQTAPKITLDAPTKQAINAHVKEMFDALSAKNVDKATALFRLSARLGYAARNLPPEKADADNRADWVKTFAEPNWHMKPINYATLTYDLIADGRVVNVSGPDNTYALMNLKGDAAYDLYFCLINGQWTQIR